MTTLITGATGFVGSAVLRKLLDRGEKVRILKRPSSCLSNLSDLDVELCEGDLTDPESLNQAVQGITALYHIAADYRLWARDPHTIYRVNVDGTRNLLRCARDAGVRRVVYTSSVAVLGLREDGQPANEDTPSSLDDMVGHYKRSKFLAEQVVISFAKEGLPVVIVNPSTPMGPRDIKPTPTGRMVWEAARGKMPAFVDTGLNVVHVDDVAQGHLLAFDKGRVGERYILGGEDMSLKEILITIAELTGHRPPLACLPRSAIYPVALLAECYAYMISRKEPFVTLDGLRLAKKKMFFSTGKAERELKYKHRPVREALKDAIEGFGIPVLA